MKKVVFILLFVISFIARSNGQTTYIPRNYKDYIISKLESGSYVKGGEIIARNVASKFVELYEADPSKFGSYFIFNDIDETFVILSDKMPTNFRQYNWAGSSNGFITNIWGQYTGKDVATYNSILAYWTGFYLKEYPPTVEKQHIGRWIELFKNVSLLKYNENLELCWSKWREINGIELRKAKLIQYTKECISDYMKVKEKGELLFTDYDKVLNLKNAVESNNWEKIEDAANLMGWTYNTYLNY